MRFLKRFFFIIFFLASTFLVPSASQVNLTRLPFVQKLKSFPSAFKKTYLSLAKSIPIGKVRTFQVLLLITSAYLFYKIKKAESSSNHTNSSLSTSSEALEKTNKKEYWYALTRVLFRKSLRNEIISFIKDPSINGFPTLLKNLLDPLSSSENTYKFHTTFFKTTIFPYIKNILLANTSEKSYDLLQHYKTDYKREFLIPWQEKFNFKEEKKYHYHFYENSLSKELKYKSMILLDLLKYRIHILEYLLQSLDQGKKIIYRNTSLSKEENQEIEEDIHVEKEYWKDLKNKIQQENIFVRNFIQSWAFHETEHLENSNPSETFAEKILALSLEEKDMQKTNEALTSMLKIGSSLSLDKKWNKHIALNLKQYLLDLTSPKESFRSLFSISFQQNFLTALLSALRENLVNFFSSWENLVKRFYTISSNKKEVHLNLEYLAKRTNAFINIYCRTYRLLAEKQPSEKVFLFFDSKLPPENNSLKGKDQQIEKDPTLYDSSDGLPSLTWRDEKITFLNKHCKATPIEIQENRKLLENEQVFWTHMIKPDSKPPSPYKYLQNDEELKRLKDTYLRYKATTFYTSSSSPLLPIRSSRNGSGGGTMLKGMLVN